jgi:hypothetical protein
MIENSMNTDESIDTSMEPILLELGKALFICQGLESSLCLLHAQMSHEEASGTPGAFEASWDFHSGKTLGQLVNALRKRIDIPEDLSAFLESGMRLRNEIIHGFVNRNVKRLMEPNSRAAVEAELANMKREVKKRDVVVNKLLDSFFAKYGFSNDDLKKNADALWEMLNNSASKTVQ